MGISIDRVVNKASIIHFKCSVCLELVDDVRELRDCGHIFGKECITTCYTTKVSSDDSPDTMVDCPYCRKPFNQASIIKPSRVLVNVIDDIKIKCQIDWCSDEIAYVNRVTHENECPMYKLTCDFCKKKVTRMDLMDKECLPFVKKQFVQCLEEGGSHAVLDPLWRTIDRLQDCLDFEENMRIRELKYNMGKLQSYLNELKNLAAETNETGNLNGNVRFGRILSHVISLSATLPKYLRLRD